MKSLNAEQPNHSRSGGKGSQWFYFTSVIAVIAIVVSSVIAAPNDKKEEAPKKKKPFVATYPTTLTYESIGAAVPKFTTDSVKLKRFLQYYSKDGDKLFRISAHDGVNGPANDKPDDFTIQLISDTWRKVYEQEPDAEINQGQIGYREVIRDGVAQAIKKFQSYIDGYGGIIEIREEYRQLPDAGTFVTADKTVWVEIRGKRFPCGVKICREYFLSESYVDVEKNQAVRIPHRFHAFARNENDKWYDIKIEFDFSKEAQDNLKANPVKYAVDKIQTRNIVLRELDLGKMDTKTLGKKLNW